MDEPTKVVLTRASDLNANNGLKHYILLTGIDDLKRILMKYEEPVIVMFAAEVDAPAELEVMLYDDFIEHEEI